MKKSNLLPLLCLVAASASAHPDGTGKMINDVITFKELTALSDQDDGGGDSEYCARIKTRHGAVHTLMTTDRLVCYDVDWDDPSTEAGVEWHELPVPRLPLIGTEKSIDTNMVLATHFHECEPTAPWTVSVTLYEVDYSPAGEILDDIAKLIRDEGKTVASIFGISDPRILATTGVAASVAKLAGKWIDRVVNQTTRLGGYEWVFHDGAGDPDQTVDSNGTLSGQHMKAQFSKTVAVVGACSPVTPKYFINDTQRSQNIDGQACYRNATAPLCLNPGEASQQQFAGLKTIAEKIAAVAPEVDTDATAEGAQEVQAGLIGLTGDIARTTAMALIEKATENAELDDQVFEMAAILETADRDLSNAVDGASAAALIGAIDGYAQIHAALAPLTYGETFQVAWRDNFMAAMVRAQGLARRSKVANRPDAAGGYVAQMLAGYAMLDNEMREEMLPLMLELFGQDIKPLFDVGISDAAGKLLEQL